MNNLVRRFDFSETRKHLLECTTVETTPKPIVQSNEQRKDLDYNKSS